MYYYQIQLKLKVCQVSYCDFVVWNNEQLSCQKIVHDSQFTEDALKKVERFFKQCILPELIAKWFTQPKTDQISSASSDKALPSSSNVLYKHRVMKMMMYHLLVHTLMVIPLLLYKGKMLMENLQSWHQLMVTLKQLTHGVIVG